MTRIFISYRRDDSAGYAGRLFDRLSAHFGAENVFIDVGALQPGEDFASAITEAVEACGALLAVIGRRWATITSADGTRRLDDPDDFVRLEITLALQRENVLVIPVLVGGAHVPDEADLPEPLQPLAARQAFTVRDDRFHADVDALIQRLEKRLNAVFLTGQTTAIGADDLSKATLAELDRTANRPALPPPGERPGTFGHLVARPLLDLIAAENEDVWFTFDGEHEDDVLVGRLLDVSGHLDLQDYDGQKHGVSRNHARLAYTGSFWQVTDLNSRYGTFVDGKRLRNSQSVPLRFGQELRFGKWAFTVGVPSGSRYPDDRDTAPPPDYDITPSPFAQGDDADHFDPVTEDLGIETEFPVERRNWLGTPPMPPDLVARLMPPAWERNRAAHEYSTVGRALRWRSVALLVVLVVVIVIVIVALAG